MSDILLKIEGLHASVEDKEILKGVNLTIRKVHEDCCERASRGQGS